MHVIIAGCGRVGSQLATELVAADHEVVVIDKDRRAFRRLHEDFGGTLLHGIVFDRATLEEAGVKRAQAFVAVTSGDNSNIVSARAAKEHYGVDRVVARIYDPVRATIFEQLGITTIASAQWTAEAVLRSLLPEDERISGSIGPGHGDVVLVTFLIPEGVQGLPVANLAIPGEAVLAAVTREGRTSVPVPGGLVQEDDRVHLAVQRGGVDGLRAHLRGLTEEERA